MKKILVVDDDRMILLTLKRLLAKEGYKVLAAENGEAAVAILKEIGYDCNLVISDLKMPGMSGVEVIVTIRKLLAELGKEPVPEIIITGYAKEDIYQDALKLNAKAYIDKPFDMRPLLEAVHNFIG